MPDARVPPGPPGLPILGNALSYLRDPLGFLTRCAREYGDVVRLRAPRQTFYMVSHPDSIEQVLRHNHRDYIKWKLLRDTSKMFGQGLLTSEGDFWKQQRKLANPAFRQEQVQTYAGVMVEHTLRMLETWKPGETRVVTDDMLHLALAIITRTLFDVDLTREAKHLEGVLGSVLDYFGSPINSLLLPSWFPTLSNLRYHRAVRILDEMITRQMAERRSKPAVGNDLLSRLLAARDEEGKGMTDTALRDEVITLGFAGHKTTAAALTYAYWLLARHPEVDAQLGAEVREVLGDREATAEDVPQLRFTQAIVKEALRLYPPSWGIGREAIRDTEVGGYTVPKGTQVMTVQYVVHRDPRWFDDPETFHPERWLGDLGERLPRCAYFPFGDGPRICIGDHFAMLETVLILATVAKRYRLTLVPGQTIRLVPSMTLWPKPGIRLAIEERPRHAGSPTGPGA